MRSQHSIPEVEEPNVSVDPSPALPPNVSASTREVTAKCDSPHDLSNGKLRMVLDLAETRYKYTLEKVQLILPHANADPSPVYQYAMPADRFPALRALYIGGFFPTVNTMYTFRNLRHLRLCSFYRGLDGILMSIHQFIEVLGAWTQLEELELRGYYPALAFSEGQPRPPTVAFRNLRKLIIADAPEFFPVLLPCLRLQPTADVHLITLHHLPAYPATAGEAFWALHFEDRHINFPILSAVDEVTISTASPEQEEYGLRVAGRSAKGGSFTYDIRTTASIALVEDVKFRHSVVDWAIQTIPHLFKSNTRMRTIRCAASCRNVVESSWVAMFQAYAALKELAVDGSGMADLGDLFVALRCSRPETNVMCQTLRRIVVNRAVYSPKFMEEVARCFLHRQYNSGGAAARMV